MKLIMSIPIVNYVSVLPKGCHDKFMFVRHFASPLGLGLGRTYPIPGGGSEIKESVMHMAAVSDGKGEGL